MAKKLTEIPNAGESTKYPWREWSDGDPWLLIHGEDYEVSTESMRRAAYAHAKRTGTMVRTALTREGLVVQFVKLKKKAPTSSRPVRRLP